MTTTNVTPTKPSHLATAAHLGIGAAIGGALIAAVDQGKVVEALPKFWKALSVMVNKNYLGALELYDEKSKYVKDCYRKAKSGLLVWTVISLGLLLLGVGLADGDGWKGGRVLIGASMLSMSAMAIVLYAMSDVIVGLALHAWKFASDGIRETVSVAAAILGREPQGLTDTEKDEQKAEMAKIRSRVKLILPTMLMVNLGIMTAMVFPSWETLGWVVCFLGAVSAIFLGLVYLDTPMKAAVDVIVKVLIVLLVATFVVFVYYQKAVKTRVDGAIERTKDALVSHDPAPATSPQTAHVPAAAPATEKPSSDSIVLEEGRRPSSASAPAKTQPKRRVTNGKLLKQLDADLAALDE